MFAYQNDDEYVGALVGHSYIHRFRAALGYVEDVDTIPEARQLATLLRVEQKFTQIYTISKVRDDHPGAPAGIFGVYEMLLYILCYKIKT